MRSDMGGVATIERLRNLDPNVAAIICSGSLGRSSGGGISQLRLSSDASEAIYPPRAGECSPTRVRNEQNGLVFVSSGSTTKSKRA